MGSKHKEAQAARRLAREKMRGYGKQWGEKLSVFNEALRPRPKYMPRKVWRWLTNIFVNVDSIEQSLMGDKK